MEQAAMRNTISALTAVGLAIAGGPTLANAQTVIADQPVETVITQQPVQTVRTTTETVRTLRHGARPIVRRRVVTTTTRQTVVSQRIVAPRPLYDVVPPAPVAARTYPQPLYDVVAPAATVDETVIDAAPPVGAAIPVYRYVYEPDRILVVDPVTNLAIEAIPR
jgi:hypothetical protein